MNIEDIKEALEECQGLTDLTDSQARYFWDNLPLRTRNKYNAVSDEPVKDDKSGVE